MTKNVFLTGAFGNVGEQTLMALLKKGYNVTAFDVRTPATEKKQARLAKSHRFTTMWGDLRDAASTAEAVAAAKPSTILHIAAVIAPVAYTIPELAYAVNVEGTRNLIKAAKAYGSPRFVFTSSYSVHGPRSPHATDGPLTSQSPTNASDTYGRHKVEGEKMVAASGLPYAVLRLPAVQALDPNWGTADIFPTFGFMIPYNQKRNGCDVRDVALAFANAVEADIDGKTFIVGGAGDWNSSSDEMIPLIYGARGIKNPPPNSWSRTVDQSKPEVFYYEDHVDASDTQAALQFQQHSMQDYLEEVSKGMGAAKLLMPFIGGMVVNNMKKLAWADQTEPDTRTMWEVVCETFGLAPDAR